jgi:hypothetical protein
MSDEIKKADPPAGITPEALTPPVKPRSFNGGLVPGETFKGVRPVFEKPISQEETDAATVRRVGKMETQEYKRWIKDPANLKLWNEIRSRRGSR